MKFIILLGLFFIGGCQAEIVGRSEPADETIVCETDADCVPSICCHADSCVDINSAPSCEGVGCTLECRPGTLDCGGSCLCVDNECVAQIENP